MSVRALCFHRNHGHLTMIICLDSQLGDCGHPPTLSLLAHSCPTYRTPAHPPCDDDCQYFCSWWWHWLKVLIMPVWLNAPTLESRSGLADDITQTFLTHVISLSADTSKHPPTHPPTHTNLIWLPTSFHWWCTTEFFSLYDCFCLEHLDLGSEVIINHIRGHPYIT